jgi:hypothetical protein
MVSVGVCPRHHGMTRTRRFSVLSCYPERWSVSHPTNSCLGWPDLVVGKARRPTDRRFFQPRAIECARTRSLTRRGFSEAKNRLSEPVWLTATDQCQTEGCESGDGSRADLGGVVSLSPEGIHFAPVGLGRWRDLKAGRRPAWSRSSTVSQRPTTSSIPSKLTFTAVSDGV